MMNQYSRLSREFELINGYAWKSEIVGVLKGLGFTERGVLKQISTLSGGQRHEFLWGKLLLTSRISFFSMSRQTILICHPSHGWGTYLLNYRSARSHRCPQPVFS